MKGRPVAKMMSQSGPRLEMHTERIEVTTGLPQPDPKWTHTDRAGHAHAYGTKEDPYPTLALRRSEPYWCEDCQDEHTDTWFECPQCGEKIEPGTYIDSSPQYIPGLTAYYIDGQEVSRAEGEALRAQLETEREQALRRRAAVAAREKTLLTEQAMRSEGFTEEQIGRVIARMTDSEQP